jgi:hypothetical protein
MYEYIGFLFRLEWNFSRQVLENTKISNFMKILALGAELLHPAGKTDMTKLTVAFRQSADAPKIAGSTYNQTSILRSSA